MRRLAVVFVLSLLLAACVSSPAAVPTVQGTPSADEVNAVAKNLYCPVCANVPLDVCGTAACAQWRGQIAELLAEGYSEQQVYDYFAAQYGQSVLALPPARGLNWLVYVIPPLGIVLAGFLLGRNLARWKQSAAGAADLPTVDDDYARSLEEELKARR
ncbi:MAG: cytochrome c-type biogenesis protein CcmH [Anaerolineales bacterium]|nr:cytochrome c-type biogenesis protein CcmH [Anaerolineales bacterium]